MRHFYMLLAALMLVSCSLVFYQVYDIEVEGLTKTDSYLYYENDECRIVYSLWEEDIYFEKSNLSFLY